MPAEAHALSRSAPLTPAQFRARRQVAEQRNVPLHVLLNGIPGRFSQRRPTPRRSGARELRSRGARSTARTSSDGSSLTS